MHRLDLFVMSSLTMRRVALFPGQGSQHPGMTQELYENFKVVREIFEEASDSIRVDLKKLCFEGPDTELTLTENTQPSLLTSSIAAFRVAQMEQGFTPDAVAGHSLGEYTALVASGSLHFSQAVRWVRERGKAMQVAVPPGQGTMAAVLGMEDEDVAKICSLATEAAIAKRKSGASADVTVESVVEPANFNSPGQVVIAGSKDGIAEAIALIKSGSPIAGGKAMPLPVSAPFHCRLMKPARERMAELFGQATSSDRPQPLQFAYVPNRTGRLSREPGVVFDLLIEQVDHPVLWKQSMQTLLESGCTTAIEFGPGKVLAGLMKRIAQPRGHTVSLLSVGDLAGLKALESLSAPKQEEAAHA